MIDKKLELEFYKKELYENILPFWEKYSPDLEFGGIFNCFTNNGGDLLSTDKYMWSQGRMLWTLSRIIKRRELSESRMSRIEETAKKTAEFLIKYSRLENGNCIFLTDREGNRKLSSGVYDASIYADCFVVMGLSEYASLTSDKELLAFSRDFYLHVYDRIKKGGYMTEPYPVPEGYRLHGIPMIMANTSRVVADALASMNDEMADTVSNYAYGFSKDSLDFFTDENYILHEAVRVDGSFDTESQLGRYINPGHTIEDCWFMETEWSRFKDNERYEKTKKVLKNAIRLGWDKEYGGIRLFADMDGTAPHGTIPNPLEPMIKKTNEDNGSKLWWVHSEALYTTLLFSEDEEIERWYHIIKEYVFKTFPNTENDRGEWIQIRSRDGSPESRVVALPVKDPYHIMRNLLLIIELLERA